MRRAFVLIPLVLACAGAHAQARGEAERKLQTVQRELKAVAAERRELEGRRGQAAVSLREVDERVGASSRALIDTQQRLTRDGAALADLQQRRTQLQASLAGRRQELARLLRAAYRQGPQAPLKALLSQDSVADAQRMLTYHRYLQAQRATRIRALGTQLAELDAIETQITERRSSLAQAQAQQREHLAQLERDRHARAQLVAKLDASYQDKRQREQALGRDAEALSSLLKKLREAAARAEAQRRTEAARAAREARAAAASGKRTPRGRTVEAGPVVRQPAPQVGGLGWPLSGALLAGYGGTMPDGRRSDGLLIAAGAGTPVKAVGEGTVVYAGWMTGYGQLLIVDHGNGYMSLYAHNDALLHGVGDRVHSGDALATVGTSGGHGRPALYFELRRDGAPVNPSGWLRH